MKNTIRIPEWTALILTLICTPSLAENDCTFRPCTVKGWKREACSITKVRVMADTPDMDSYLVRTETWMTPAENGTYSIRFYKRTAPVTSADWSWPSGAAEGYTGNIVHYTISLNRPDGTPVWMREVHGVDGVVSSAGEYSSEAHEQHMDDDEEYSVLLRQLSKKAGCQRTTQNEHLR